jgi:hypothetical protein
MTSKKGHDVKAHDNDAWNTNRMEWAKTSWVDRGKKRIMSFIC